MPTTIESTEYPTLLNIINGTYRDEVEQILSAQLQDDDSTVAIGLDGKKQVAALITENRIKVRLLNPDDIEGGAADFAEGDEADTADQYREQLRTQAGPLIDEWVGKVKALLDESGDLASFSERLLDLYPDLDGQRLRRIMSDAMTAASIAGSQESAS
jgi:phage gp29-like protein